MWHFIKNMFGRGEAVNQRGNVMLFVLVFGTLAFSFIVVGVAGYAISENAATRHKVQREQAFQIAEAGVNYYRWHLAHYKNDYQDGTATSGPYVHEYLDKNSKLVGYYSLNITPPPPGSTVVIIESTGWTVLQPGSRRTIRVRVGFPAFTDYAYLSNVSTIVDLGEIIHGKFHSNSGIQFDGTTDAPVTSAVSSYKCKLKNNRGCSDKNQTKAGIWGAGGPTSFWQYPVPKVDIKAAVPKADQIKKGAKASGLYLSSSGKQGWHVTFLANGTMDFRKVLTTKCYKGKKETEEKHDHWFCTDIATEGTATNYPIPSNGFIYLNDRVWVDGVVNGRATITNKGDRDIIIGNNLVYAAKDGTSALGLIAGRGVVLAHDAPDNLEINGVLLTTKDQAKRHYYKDSKKASLTLYGSVITFKGWYWNWVDKKGVIDSGYMSSTLTYDANLTYAPPPGFPFGADYNLISWEEVK